MVSVAQGLDIVQSVDLFEAGEFARCFVMAYRPHLKRALPIDVLVTRDALPIFLNANGDSCIRMSRRLPSVRRQSGDSATRRRH